MLTWDNPAFIAVALAGAILLTVWLFRVGMPKSSGVAFECDVCGRKRDGSYARQWRFCPFCGAPKPRPPPRY